MDELTQVIVLIVQTQKKELAIGYMTCKMPQPVLQLYDWLTEAQQLEKLPNKICDLPMDDRLDGRFWTGW